MGALLFVMKWLQHEDPSETTIDWHVTDILKEADFMIKFLHKDEPSIYACSLWARLILNSFVFIHVFP